MLIPSETEKLVKTIYSGSGTIISESPSWLPKADFSRTQTDLIAKNYDGEEVVFVDYFTNYDPPSILTDNGLLLKGTLLKALAGPLAPGQYAQAAGGEVLSIGEVSTVTGTVKATRLDGTTTDLNGGDPIFQGDTIETVGNGSVGLVFVDKTTLSLSEGGKMVLDELVYDPESGTGSMAVDMMEGAFSFVSGEIAAGAPDAMKVTTPVATVGIRGTTVAGKAAVEGNENAFTLLQDSDGGVGQISISNAGGTQVLAQVGATTTVSSFNAPPPAPVILSAAQIQANYGSALNVLPPTPDVAPQPQAAPPPEEEQQQEEAVEEEGSEEGEEEASEEAVSEEEGEGEGEGEGEEGPPEGEGEEGPPEGEEGPPVGPDGEPLAEGEGGPDGEGPGGPDGEALAEGEEGPPLGPDGEPLPPGEGGPPVDEGLPAGDVVAPLDGGPGPGGEGPTGSEEIAAKEAFETALADGASPEQAMAAAAEAGGFINPAGAADFAGGPGNFTPLGGPAAGPSGQGDFDKGPVGNLEVKSEGNPLGAQSNFGPISSFGSPSSFGVTAGDPFATSTPGFSSGPGNSFGSAIGGGFGGMAVEMFGGPMSSSSSSFGFSPDDVSAGPKGAFALGPADPFGGPVGFGPVAGNVYSSNLTENSFVESSYVFDDPSLYNDFIERKKASEEETIETNFVGTTGNDVITGTIFADVMTGGLGDDTYVLNNIGDVITEMANAGTDTIQSSITHTLASNIENLTLTGSGNINGTGNSLGNTLTANSGTNTLSGLAGDDTYVITSSGHTITESSSAGTDTVQSSVTFTLGDNIENLTLTGSDNINGTGNSLANTLTGNSGNNTINGGGGIDTMTGGGGNDVFYLNGTSAFGTIIKDFTLSDTLRINHTFAEPTTQYNVTRTSTMYTHDSTSRLTYRSTSNDNELPYVFNFTENVSDYLSKSFRSDVVSSIRYTKAVGGNGLEQFFVVGDGTNSAIWMWDDLSQGYGVSTNELTYIAKLENFNNDSLTGSEIVFGTLS